MTGVVTCVTVNNGRYGFAEYKSDRYFGFLKRIDRYQVKADINWTTAFVSLGN